MIKYRKILLIGLLLLLGCDNSNNPFNDSEPYNLITIDIGEVRDLDYSDMSKQLFVGTESEGIYIYNIESEVIPVNGIQLSDSVYLSTLYENIEWGEGKDIRDIQYSNNTSILYALDRFGYTYHGYLPHLLGEPNSMGLTCSDTLLTNICAFTQTHATKFILDDSNESPELYILYKHNAANELYTEQSYSSLKFMDYFIAPQQSIDFCEFFSTCENEAISVQDTLGYKVNDVFYLNDKIYIANPRDSINSFQIYNVGSDFITAENDTILNGEVIDEFLTESEVKSIYAVNDYVLAGTGQGCYITLLEGGGLSDNQDSKLLLAENYAIHDIYFSENKLILSAGIEGIIVYNWDGNSINVNEILRIHSSYAYTARFINNMYFIATKNGLEIYNIEE